MAAALVISASFVMAGLRKPHLDKLPGDFQLPPHEPSLLHQFPIELRQQVYQPTTLFDNRDTDPRSYEPLRVNSLLSSRLYQTVHSLPVHVTTCPKIADHRPPINYKRAYKPLLLLNRETHLDLLSTITTEVMQAIHRRKVPKATLVIDYQHHHRTQADAVYVAWRELPLCAHAFQRIDLIRNLDILLRTLPSECVEWTNLHEDIAAQVLKVCGTDKKGQSGGNKHQVP